MRVKCFQLAPESTIARNPISDSLNGIKSLTGHSGAFARCEGKHGAYFPRNRHHLTAYPAILYYSRMGTKPQTFRLLKTQPAKLAPSGTKPDTSHKAQHYGRRWQKIRAMQLAREPLCRHCSARGYVTPATQVDHIIRLRRGGTNDFDNLQSLCASCHSRKTAKE